MHFQLKLTSYQKVYLLFLVILAACNSSEPVEPGKTLTLKTDQPISYLEHWHGEEGVLARFGKNSEIGALLQFEFKNRRQFVIFDQTGKEFILDKSGLLSGPYPVSNLFNITNIWNTASDAEANKMAEKLELEGVDAAVWVSLPADASLAFTFSTKLGNVYNLWKWDSKQTWEEKDRDYGIASHSSVKGGLEAMYVFGPSGKQDAFYDHAFLIDHTGKNVENGDSGALGSVSSYYENIPSSKIEAACYLNDQDKYPTLIQVLGEHDAITNGQFLFISTEVSPGKVEKILVDLRKDY
jgi:hypothetical protein